MHLPVCRDLAVVEATNTTTRLRRNWIFIFWPFERDTKTYIMKTVIKAYSPQTLFEK